VLAGSDQTPTAPLGRCPQLMGFAGETAAALAQIVRSAFGLGADAGSTGSSFFVWTAR
jgi:hypothetical protein